MHRSTDRLLTTHVGSLPRPDEIVELVGRGGTEVDSAKLKQAVNDVVARQHDIGIDIVSDGEFSKPNYLSYVRDRLDGLSAIGGTRGSHWGSSRDAQAFPDFYANQVVGATGYENYGCTGPLSYKGQDRLQTDLDNLKTAMTKAGVEAAFLPSISPSNIEAWHPNSHYATDDEYRTAICDAMRVEYAAIVDAGFSVQIDDPRLVTYYMTNPDLSIAECRAWAERQVEILNYALKGIPRDKIRYHTCYSIDIGPRVHDMEMKDIVDIVLKVNAGAFSFEASNPRHEHEWTVWRDAKRPDDTVLIPGVVTHCSVLVEHPELVAERLLKFVNFAGKENVIAGTDCGFATFAGHGDNEPSIVWAKLKALVEGAEIASRRLASDNRSSAA